MMTAYLVCEEDAGHGASVDESDLGVQVRLPLGDAVEGGGPRDVEHDERPRRLLVVHTRHVTEPLLT